MPNVVLTEVEAELKRRVPKGKLHHAVAVDGSDVSTRALQAALHVANAKKGDGFTVLHVAASDKDYLPRNLQPRHLQRLSEDEAAGHHLQAAWICQEKNVDETTCMTLTQMADKQGVDVLFVGSYGRKGEKLDMLGSVSDFSLRESHASVCIVRMAGAAWSGPIKYMCAIDGSHASALAFCQLIMFMMKPGDTVDVVLATSGDGTVEQATIQSYAAFKERYKVPGICKVHCLDRKQTTVPDGILDAASELGSDVLVLGVGGTGRKKLGSVSEALVVRAHCTTLIVKDPLDVVSNRFTAGGARTVMEELRPGSANGPSGRSSMDVPRSARSSMDARPSLQVAH